MRHYLLLQVRNYGDPMREQEVNCFARTLGCLDADIQVHDLLTGIPSQRQLAAADLVLLGGSGEYSATAQVGWLDRAFDALRDLYRQGKPTFASCWGFQALARALGGEVRHDPEHAELGTHEVFLTPAGQADPIFAPLGSPFIAQMGHEDRVVSLPPGAVLLASTTLVENQAYRMGGVPIYATQFHPELSLPDMLARVRNYPQYITRIAKVPADEFPSLCRETPGAAGLLRRFIDTYLN